ncbi:MAG: GNAT family N-acetyltransferase [Candidatus Micrarchaeota archaeon]
MFGPLEEKDVEPVQELIATEFPYLRNPRLQVQAKLNLPAFFLFKIEREKKLAGFIELEKLAAKIVRLNGLAVFPRFRKKGVGTELLKESILFLKQNRFEKVELLVKRENKVAQKMYQKAGFVWVSTLEKEIDDAVVDEYALQLSPRKKWLGIF